MHSGGFEVKELTYTRLEGNLIRHRGDRLIMGTGEKSLLSDPGSELRQGRNEEKSAKIIDTKELTGPPAPTAAGQMNMMNLTV